MNNKHKEFGEKIMQQIKSDKLEIRSKFSVLAEELLFITLIIVSLLFSAFLFNLIIHYTHRTELPGYLRLGKFGTITFLQSLPYDWILGSILLFLVGSYLIKRFDISYRKHFSAILAALLLVVTLSGIATAYTTANDQLSNFFSRHAPPLERFYARRLPATQKHSVIGQVTAVNEQGQSITLQVDDQSITVNFNDQTHFPTGTDIVEGSQLMVVGEKDTYSITAFGIRILRASPSASPRGPKGGPGKNSPTMK